MKAFDRLLAVPLTAVALLAAAGCGAVPRSGETTTLQGVLVLKGNEPFTRPTLMVNGSDLWELQGVPVAAARALQNKAVDATGVVTRSTGIGAQLPSLRVTKLQGR